MSATTKKKHVTKEVLEEYPLPDGNKEVAKVQWSNKNHILVAEIYLFSLDEQINEFLYLFSSISSYFIQTKKQTGLAAPKNSF